MTEHFNKLTPAEAERLAWLMEECGEVIQAAGKILRHGYDSTDPTNPKHEGNRVDLHRELTDLVRAICHMTNRGDIAYIPIESAKEMKLRYMHHQENEFE